MKKTNKLKNLVFENILSESLKFTPPTEDSYIKTYPEFIKFFKNINSISKHDLVISSHFVYGWMPTIIELKFQDMEEVLKSLNKAKNGAILTIAELELLKNTINNSLVGLSKLLHFINPVDYAIWDSRIYRYSTDKKSSYGIGNTQLYLNFLSKLNEIESHVDFNEIKKNVSTHFDYVITSKRVIELLMFEADKRDNKKLI
ncbi:hypothetical protein OAI37_05520 [Flavobacteriaceae bacterium]|nr:hypothetical protein [Flavobacteriaceae bacterium]